MPHEGSIGRTAAARLERALFLANCFNNDEEMAAGIELLRDEVEYARDYVEEQCERLDLDEGVAWGTCVVRIHAFLESGAEHGALLPSGFFDDLSYFRKITELPF